MTEPLTTQTRGAPAEAAARVYHIATAVDWAAAERSGSYPGGALCRENGFIHFSGGDQVAGTLARFFAGRDDLVLLSAAADDLAPALRWEEVPGAGTFPHYYGVLATGTVRCHGPIPLGPDGRHLPPFDGGAR